MTIFPERYRSQFENSEKTDEDTNDDDSQNSHIKQDRATKVYGKDRNDQRHTENTDEDTNDDMYETEKFNKGRATKVYEINTEEKKIFKEKKKHYRMQKIEMQKRQMPKQHYKLTQRQVKPQKITEILK